MVNALSESLELRVRRDGHEYSQDFSRGKPQGYAAALSTKQLSNELVYHAATWRPSKKKCKDRSEEVDLALSIAWDKVSNGSWRCFPS